MDDTLIEELLNEDENSSLDFKRDQYQFSGASDEEKSEIIKDILAFANAWRRTDAFILIGVEEVRGGRSIVYGTTNHLLEQNIQQLVNSKTNRPIEFSYRIFPFEGKQIGVICIPIQDRPFYLNNKYGRLNKGTVYIRRGSSTDIADIDEIARMGAANVAKQQQPSLALQFCDPSNWQGVGNVLKLDPLVLRFPERSQIPRAEAKRKGPFDMSFSLSSINPNYYREYADYFFISYLCRPIGFILKNTGSTLLMNARVQITTPKINGLRFLVKDNLPKTPVYDQLSSLTSPPRLNIKHNPETIHIGVRGNDYDIQVDFGNVQPKADSLSQVLYVGAEQTMQLDIEGIVYADNLPDPVRIPLTVNIETQERVKSAEDLQEIIKKLNEERLKQIKEDLEIEE